MYETEVKAVGLSFKHVQEKLGVGDKVKLFHEKDNQYDPNALAIHTLGGEHIGYVGKKDKLRSKILRRVSKEEVTMPVLIANYHKDGSDKLWDSVEEGDMVQLWLRAYSKTPLDDDSFIEVESFTGEKVLWSEYLHICTDLKGNELIGGSTYASQFEKEFDRDRIAHDYANKHDLEMEQVVDYWEGMGTLSADYGTAVHSALEHYSKSFKTFGHEDSLPRVPHLKEAVKAFLKVSDFKDCIAEPLITDVEKGMSGWIDNLRFVDEKTVVVEDFKTNTFKDQDYSAKFPAKLKSFEKQLSYYGTILENHGYKVQGLVVWHWYQNKWYSHPIPFKPVKEYQR